MSEEYKHIFSGVIVLDITKILSGPLATRYLADYGAAVIKIEHPQKPDDSRTFPPLKSDWSGYFEMLNRNKESITLNLQRPEDRNVFYKLCTKADIVVENLTPSSKTNLQIDYPMLSKINQRLIYASLAGVDQETNRKYYDVIAQAESGLASLSGDKNQPMKIGPAIIDAFTGVNLAFALASALYYREKSGKGQHISVSMLGTAVQLLEQNLIEYSVTGSNPQKPANYDTAIAPFGLFRTKDGYVAIACGNNTLWKSFSNFLQEQVPFDKEIFATNSLRLQHQNKLGRIIERVLINYTTEIALKDLTALDIPCGKVNEMSDVAVNNWFFKNKFLVKVKHKKLGTYIIPGVPITFGTEKQTLLKSAPKLGRDNKKYGL